MSENGMSTHEVTFRKRVAQIHRQYATRLEATERSWKTKGNQMAVSDLKRSNILENEHDQIIQDLQRQREQELKSLRLEYESILGGAKRHPLPSNLQASHSLGHVHLSSRENYEQRIAAEQEEIRVALKHDSELRVKADHSRLGKAGDEDLQAKVEKIRGAYLQQLKQEEVRHNAALEAQQRETEDGMSSLLLATGSGSIAPLGRSDSNNTEKLHKISREHAQQRTKLQDEYATSLLNLQQPHLVPFMHTRTRSPAGGGGKHTTNTQYHPSHGSPLSTSSSSPLSTTSASPKSPRTRSPSGSSGIPRSPTQGRPTSPATTTHPQTGGAAPVSPETVYNSVLSELRKQHLLQLQQLQAKYDKDIRHLRPNEAPQKLLEHQYNMHLLQKQHAEELESIKRKFHQNNPSQSNTNMSYSSSSSHPLNHSSSSSPSLLSMSSMLGHNTTLHSTSAPDLTSLRSTTRSNSQSPKRVSMDVLVATLIERVKEFSELKIEKVASRTYVFKNNKLQTNPLKIATTKSGDLAVFNATDHNWEELITFIARYFKYPHVSILRPELAVTTPIRDVTTPPPLDATRKKKGGLSPRAKRFSSDEIKEHTTTDEEGSPTYPLPNHPTQWSGTTDTINELKQQFKAQTVFNQLSALLNPNHNKVTSLCSTTSMVSLCTLHPSNGQMSTWHLLFQLPVEDEGDGNDDPYSQILRILPNRGTKLWTNCTLQRHNTSQGSPRNCEEVSIQLQATTAVHIMTHNSSDCYLLTDLLLKPHAQLLTFALWKFPKSMSISDCIEEANKRRTHGTNPSPNDRMYIPNNVSRSMSVTVGHLINLEHEGDIRFQIGCSPNNTYQPHHISPIHSPPSQQQYAIVVDPIGNVDTLFKTHLPFNAILEKPHPTETLSIDQPTTVQKSTVLIVTNPKQHKCYKLTNFNVIPSDCTRKHNHDLLQSFPSVVSFLLAAIPFSRAETEAELHQLEQSTSLR